MSTRKHLVVTGANGFVGRRLVNAALARDWQVTALCRNPAGLALRDHDRLSVLPWKAGEKIGDQSVLNNADVLCHTAAFIPPDFSAASFASECFQTNALGTLHLAQEARQCGVKRFVHLSSAQVYDRIGRPSREDDPAFPVRHAPYYLASKLSADIFLTHLSSSSGLPVAILRPSAIYGPGMSSGVVFKFFETLRKGSPVTVSNGGRQAADFVFVDDVVEAVFAVAAYEFSGIVNVGSGQLTSTRELAQHMVAVLGVAPDLVTVQPEIAGAGVQSFHGIDIEKLNKTLGHYPRNIAQGLTLWAKSAMKS